MARSIGAVGCWLWLAAVPLAAAGQECQPVREVHPLPDEPLPVDGALWDVCYFTSGTAGGMARADEVCAPPVLRSPSGAIIELEMDRRAEAPPSRRVSRYRPQVALEVGVTYTLDPGPFASPSGPRSVRVVAASTDLPAPPVVQGVEYSVLGSEAQAQLRFAAFQGLLVKDVGAQGSASLGAVDVSHVASPGPALLLAHNACVDNFAAAAPGASAAIRFGVLDLAGMFSGWGEPYTLDFPRAGTATSASGAAAESAESEDGGCALIATRPARTGWGAVLLLVALAAVTRLHRRVPYPDVRRGRVLRQDFVGSETERASGN